MTKAALQVKVRYMPRSKSGMPLMDKPINFVGLVLGPADRPGYYKVRSWNGTTCYRVPVSEMDECQ